MKWAMELREFDIRFKPRTAIKGQVLANFLAEFTALTEEVVENLGCVFDVPTWRLYVDGASNAQGSGAGLVSTSPEGYDLEYSLRFDFPVSNNEAEYEALIAGLN